MKTPFPFQQTQIGTAIDAPGNRWLFADEMGVGKTGQAILACRALGCDRILVVAPAMARLVWAREFPAWWEDAPPVGVIDMNPTRKTQTKKKKKTWSDVMRCPVRVISPALINLERETAFLDSGKPAIILDEAHIYADPKAKRCKALRFLVKGYSGCLFSCTATPIPNRPIGAWNLFDMMWPRRFGVSKGGKVSKSFEYRYLDREYCQFGSKPTGLSSIHGDELGDRLKYMMSRTTRAEIAHLLPKFQIDPIPLDPHADVELHAEEWVGQQLQEVTHVAVFRYHRATAAALARRLSDRGYNVVHVDGSVPTGKRDELLQNLRAAPTGVLVSTIGAVARSISLSWASRSLLADLYWSPEQLVQLSGRQARLDADVSVGALMNVFVGQSTVQERIAFSVSEKLWDNAKLMKEGEIDKQLSGALSADISEDELLQAAFSVCSDEEMEIFSKMEGE